MVADDASDRKEAPEAVAAEPPAAEPPAAEPPASPPTLEPASTGRAKCRGCGETIARGTLRLSEHVPNPYGEGESALHFHLACAAFKRPEQFLAALAAASVPVELPELPELETIAGSGVAHPRAVRVAGAERAPSGRAHCRLCKELISKQAWRVKLDIWEEVRTTPIGFIHAACAKRYFGPRDGDGGWDPQKDGMLMNRVRAFARNLTEQELVDIAREIDDGPTGDGPTGDGPTGDGPTGGGPEGAAPSD